MKHEDIIELIKKYDTRDELLDLCVSKNFYKGYYILNINGTWSAAIKLDNHVYISGVYSHKNTLIRTIDSGQLTDDIFREYYKYQILYDYIMVGKLNKFYKG